MSDCIFNMDPGMSIHEIDTTSDERVSSTVLELVP